MKKRDRSFWWFFAIMVSLTVILLLINLYTPVSAKELTEITAQNIEATEISIVDLQEKFNQYERIIERFMDKGSVLNQIIEEIEAAEREFLISSSLVSGVFYHITSESDGIINKYIELNKETINPIIKNSIPFDDMILICEKSSVGEWKRGIHKDTGEEYLIYVKPAINKERFNISIGITIPTIDIMQELKKEHDNQELNYSLFISEEEAEDVFNREGFNERDDAFIFDDTSVGYFKYTNERNEEIYTFKALKNGMIYIEIYENQKQTRYSNEMIIIISIFAVAAMWMVQGKNKDEKTVFDRISDYIMKSHIHKLNSIKKQGYRATIALNIGMAAGIFADVVYSVALGRGIKTLAEYLIFLILSAGILILYKFSKQGITKKMAIIIIIAGLTGPLTEHLMSGGFAFGKAGESFLWFVICQYIALFILGADKAVHVLNAVIVIIYFDVVFETIIFQRTNYEGSYLFAIGFILLAFVLYNAMEVYVSGAARHYNESKKLINELKSNQEKLLRKEKLGALGQLISGVAHEINTPIGAVKASSETMDSMFISTINEVLIAAEAFSNEDYDIYMEIVFKSLKAKQKMKSTLEVRKAKIEIKRHLKEIGIDNGEKISALLGELEIVDFEQIIEMTELFEKEHIVNILERAAKLTAFTSGIPIILYASERVTQIVIALKSYVHISSENGTIEFDLIKSIENILVLFHNQIKSNISIRRIYSSNECVITGNPDELAQVWTNMIQNAIHAMNGSGELSIEVDGTDADTVTVSIGDTGIGISKEMFNYLYDPFFSISKNNDGAGLGLSIAKRIIDKHQGELSVESQVGHGTIFHVRLFKICKL